MIELILSIALHFMGVCILGIILFIIIGLVIEKLRALYDKSLWDTREKARTELGRQIVNGSTWFTPGEAELIKIIGENIIFNNGQFDPSSARDTFHYPKDVSVTCSECLVAYSSDRDECPACRNTKRL